MLACPFCNVPQDAAPQSAPVLLSSCPHCLNPLVLMVSNGVPEAHRPPGVRDIREIAGPDSLGGRVLRLAIAAVENLPILPDIAQKVMALLRDPETTMEDLALIIQQDQIIAMKLLRLANSALYGGLNPIRDVKAACARLGFRNVSNTVLAITNGRLYTAKSPASQAAMLTLWRHALASAHCANEIAILAAQPNPDILFTAGLIHDVGKVLLLDVVSEGAATGDDAAALEVLRDSPQIYAEIETAFHALIGLHVTRHWRLPSEFALTTFCQERFETVPLDAGLPSVHIVSLASLLACASGYGYGDEQSEISLVGHPSAKFLGLNDVRLATLRVEIEDKLTPLLEISTA